MSVTPKVHLVAFEERTGGFVFVGVPDQVGRYLRTDRSVVLVACPQCRAMIGEPCKAGMRHEGYTGTTHYMRRVDAGRFKGRPVDDVEMQNITLAPDGTAAAVE